MAERSRHSTAALWSHFRFSVIGSLLSAPPARGELKRAFRSLADKTWTHPIHAGQVRFAARTIERWYYQARRERHDPVSALRRTVRKDRGNISLAPSLVQHLVVQYEAHEHWSYQLHYDNLAALVKADGQLGRLPSYSTVRRYMQANGMIRKPRSRQKGCPGERQAIRRRENREIRSYEAEYVGGLWHLDFHHGSLKVLSERGQWQRPIVLGILDDHSRLCCHLQWYLSETAEDLIHGLCQAIQKRGLPRALLTDNGPAMVAEEVKEGLLQLGIMHEKTLPYSPYQNGKQECFWATLEGRLMQMLEGVDLTLDFLNEATQAWMEMEYNRAVHREISVSPVQRFAEAADVLRCSPSSDALREAFRLVTVRIQRQSDGTISLEGKRFEIPARYRHFREVAVRYARWDLSRVDLVDRESGIVLAPIYPLDLKANADGRRSAIPCSESNDESRQAGSELPPLLKRILEQYRASGLPPAYLPKKPNHRKGKNNES